MIKVVSEVTVMVVGEGVEILSEVTVVGGNVESWVTVSGGCVSVTVPGG